MTYNMNVAMPVSDNTTSYAIQEENASYRQNKSDYMKMVKKISNSDFANSQSALNLELEILYKLQNKLKSEFTSYCTENHRSYEGALKKLEVEGKWIEERIIEISNILAQYNANFDYNPLIYRNTLSYGTQLNISNTLQKYTDASRQTAYECMVEISKIPAEALDSQQIMNIVRHYSKEEDGKLTISENDLNFIKKLNNDYAFLSKLIDDLSEIKNEDDRQFICEYIDKLDKLLESQITPSAIYNGILRPLIMYGNKQADSYEVKPEKIDKDFIKRVYDDLATIKSDLPSFNLNLKFFDIMNDQDRIVNGEISLILDIIKYDMEDREETIKSLHKLIKELGWYSYTHHFPDCTTKEIPYYFGVEIAKKLAVRDENNKLSISKKSVDYICKLKEALEETRNNELKECKNPMYYYSIDNIAAVEERKYNNAHTNPLIREQENYKDALEEVNKKSVCDFLREYTGATSGTDKIYERVRTKPSLREKFEYNLMRKEKQVISDFVEEFTDSNGEIDSKYARIIIQLIHAGITYDSLIELTKSCINEDGSLNIAKLKTICALKKHGQTQQMSE